MTNTYLKEIWKWQSSHFHRVGVLRSLYVDHFRQNFLCYYIKSPFSPTLIEPHAHQASNKDFEGQDSFSEKYLAIMNQREK